MSQTKRISHIKNEIISRTIHELKTPLTSMYSYLQLLRRKKETIPESSAAYINKVTSELEKLDFIIDEFQTYVHIKTGRMDYSFRQVDLKDVITQATVKINQLYEERTIRLEHNLDTEVSVVGDFKRLVQVVTYLLDNAIKFSKPGSDIIVGLRKKKNMYTISVSNKGDGQSAGKGLGLGLYICKDIIKAHKGAIDMSSTVRGTTVTVEIPEMSFE